MKYLIVIFLSLVIGNLALAEPENISEQRRLDLAQRVFSSDLVKPIKELAESKLGASYADVMGGPSLSIDCAKTPAILGDLAAGYCEIDVQLNYGWYSDPFLKLKVVGFIKKDKIQTGDLDVQTSQKGSRLDLKDLKIISVVVETPLPTGLE